MGHDIQKLMEKHIRVSIAYFKRQHRDSRYLLLLIVALFFGVISTLQALSQGLFDSLERPLFEVVNDLPTFLDGMMHAITQLGGLFGVVFWIGLAWFLANRRVALSVAGAGFLAWFVAKFIKSIVERGRPEALLDSLRLFNDNQFGGYGFPSGHSTLVAACITVIYFQVERKYRKYLLLAVFLVGLSRMYLGAHFPLDVIGGWALGAIIGSVICLIFGVSGFRLNINQIKTALRKKGYQIKHAEFAQVDARGSRPVLMVAKTGEKYFGKIFGAQEHAADWLFKSYRFFKYKNLQGEEPYISSRRNIELESFATLWAKNAGVRVPMIIDLIKIRASWMLVLENLDTKVLSEHGKIRQETLIDAWRQVRKMHQANMAHRDLRAANIMVDKQHKAWIIDFGFAEVSPKKQRKYMDIAEFLMSTCLLVGVERSVDAVIKVIDKNKLKATLPYLASEVFSGATAKSLKSNKELLHELRKELKNRLGVKQDIDSPDIVRLNKRRMLNILLVGILIYVIVPQLQFFRGAIGTLDDIKFIWLIPIALASSLTYFFTATSYISLSSVPLKLIRTSLVQLAASFVSKVTPGPIGSTSLNLKYFSKVGIDKVDAAALIATNGTIGVMMFFLPLSIFLLFQGDSIGKLISFDLSTKQIVYAIIVVGLVVAILGLFSKIRTKFIRLITEFISSLREFTNSPKEVFLASVSALGVSLSYIFCLYACLQATGVELGFSGAVLVYVSAIIAKSVAPTPGGLGPLEAAMVATMLSFGVVNINALTVVIVYRLATFWLPIPFSLLAYRYINKKKFI